MLGLSSKEIELRRRELYASNDASNDNELRELSFRGWVNSCLIYKQNDKLTKEQLTKYNPCIFQTTLELYRVEIERALEIVEEQKERFKSAIVHENVGTDSEGVSYNSCEWN